MEHVSVASLAGNVPVVTFSGLSKSHVICGYRVGWMCISGDKECISDYIDGLNLLSSMRLCANVPGQMVVEIALDDCEEMKAMLRKGGRLYEQREFVYERLNAIDGVSVVKPKAGFYIFPLFAFDFTKWDQVVIFLIFFISLGFLCIKHNYFLENIVLEILKYDFYECTLKNVDGEVIDINIVSKRRLEKETTIYLKSINNEYMVDQG